MTVNQVQQPALAPAKTRGQTNANIFGLRCANGATRDLRIASAVITALISANGVTYTGTKADTYNVDNAGTLTQVGTMTFNENVSLSK